MTQKEAIRWFEEDTALLVKALNAVNDISNTGCFLVVPEVVKYEQDLPIVDIVPRWKQ